MFYKSSYSFEHAFRKHADGDYSRLYNALNCEWSQAYNNTSVYAAVDSIHSALLYAGDQRVSRGSIRKTE